MDKKAFADGLGMSGKSLAGMITQLKTNPIMREKLKKDGFADEQIPEWVAKAAEAEQS